MATGVWRPGSHARRRYSSQRQLIYGMRRWRMIASGCPVTISRSPDSAVAAVRTSKPSSVKMRANVRVVESSSSTIRSRGLEDGFMGKPRSGLANVVPVHTEQRCTPQHSAMSQAGTPPISLLIAGVQGIGDSASNELVADGVRMPVVGLHVNPPEGLHRQIHRLSIRRWRHLNFSD